MERVFQKVSSPVAANAIIGTVVYAHLVLFVYAGTYKLLDYNFFEAQLSLSPLIGQYAAILVWLVPTTELAIAILLILKRTRLYGLYLSFAIMLMFTLYVFYMLNFSPSLPCSCGGILTSLGWQEHLLFNAAFTLAAAFGIWLYKRRITLS